MSGHVTASDYHGGRQGSLAKAGGGLGIAGCVIGLLVFLGGCAGYDASFKLGFIPAVMGLVGLVLSIIGGVRNERGIEGTQVLASLFISLWALLGGLILMAVAYHWVILYGTPAGH